MEQHSEVFVGMDAAKLRHAVAVAEDGRQGEVRYLGEVGTDAESVRRLVGKLEKRHDRGRHFCYETTITVAQFVSCVSVARRLGARVAKLTRR